MRRYIDRILALALLGLIAAVLTLSLGAVRSSPMPVAVISPACGSPSPSIDADPGVAPLHDGTVPMLVPGAP